MAMQDTRNDFGGLTRRDFLRLSGLGLAGAT